jgi:phosphatidylglycerol:prolipoprotein diacylglycerol transferase
MFPILQIGPLALQVPGLILLGSIWLGLLLVEKNAKHHNIDSTYLYNLILITLISGVVGARITYILRYSGVFAENPTSLISLNTGLLDPVGGAAVGVVTATIYGQRKNMPLFRTLDALVPLFAIVYIGYSLANTASGNGFGNITDMPWGIEDLGAKRHPVQIYHAIAGIVTLILVWPNRGPLGNFHTTGVTFFAFVGIIAVCRILLDAYLASIQVTPFGVRYSQVIAWLVMAISLAAISLLQYRNPGDSQEINLDQNVN